MKLIESGRNPALLFYKQENKQEKTNPLRVKITFERACFLIVSQKAQKE